MRKKDAAAKIGVEAVTLRAWFNSAAPNIKPESRVNLAKFLGISPADLEERLRQAMLHDPATQKRWAAQERAVREGGHSIHDQVAAGAPIGEDEEEEPDRSVEPYSEMKVPEIPLFELSLAAGPWVDVEGVGHREDLLVLEEPRFRVRLAGDSMQPRYRSGAVVEFRTIMPDDIEVGKDYYVQKSDGTATFKRVAGMDQEGLTLAAINKRKYPKPLRVVWQEFARAARAVAIVELID